jgi:citronellol/citronellal dehydrogenase
LNGSVREGLRLDDEHLAECRTVLAASLLEGQVVVISGGGSGIGRATAWLAARLGATVVVCGRDREKLERTAAALKGRQWRCEAFALNIRQRDEVEAMFEFVYREHDRVDILINSAGGQYPQAATDFSEKGWHAVVDTNLTGTFHMMQCAARHWIRRELVGSVVSVVVSPRGLHHVAHTCAARAGVVAFTEAVAVEWAPLGIRVNCVAPGVIRTEGWATYGEDVRRRYSNSNPMRMEGTPWDIAEACLYIGGPGGRFITGQTIHVNGGANLWGETWTLGKPDYFVEASRAWDSLVEPYANPNEGSDAACK